MLANFRYNGAPVPEPRNEGYTPTHTVPQRRPAPRQPRGDAAESSDEYRRNMLVIALVLLTPQGINIRKIYQI